MTPEDIAIVEQTLDAMPDQSDALSASFYTRLFAATPQIRTLFPDAMADQRAKFSTMFEHIVRSIHDLDAFREQALALGAAHVGYGATTIHYDLVGEALLGALRDAMADGWTNAHDESWARAYDLIAETMMLGAAGEPDRQPSS